MGSSTTPTLTTDLTLKAWDRQPIIARLPSAGEVRLDLSGVASGAELTSGAHLAIAQETRDKVYLVDNGQKRWVTSPEVMDKFDFKYGTIRQAPQSTLDALPDGRR